MPYLMSLGTVTNGTPVPMSIIARLIQTRDGSRSDRHASRRAGNADGDGALADGHLNRASDVTRLADRLLSLGFIERVSSLGDRRDFYRVEHDPWERMLRVAQTRWRDMIAVFAEAASSRSKRTKISVLTAGAAPGAAAALPESVL